MDRGDIVPLTFRREALQPDPQTAIHECDSDIQARCCASRVPPGIRETLVFSDSSVTLFEQADGLTQMGEEGCEGGRGGKCHQHRVVIVSSDVRCNSLSR